MGPPAFSLGRDAERLHAAHHGSAHRESEQLLGAHAVGEGLSFNASGADGAVDAIEASDDTALARAFEKHPVLEDDNVVDQLARVRMAEREQQMERPQRRVGEATSSS